MAQAALPGWNPDWALFLDVDGTLLEIAAHPDLVDPAPGLEQLLEGLAVGVDGALALVSGRPIASLDALFAPLVLPAAGLHGLERRDVRGRVHYANTAEEHLHDAKRELMDFAEQHSGVLIEDKGATLALHFRGAPDLESIARDRIEGIAARLGEDFRVQEGKMVLELKPSGHTKGTAIEEFMRETPFRDRVPLFIGDDITDEDGFEAVNRSGGYSVGVGVGDPTAAQWRVDSVGEVLRWLESLLQQSRK